MNLRHIEEDRTRGAKRRGRTLATFVIGAVFLGGCVACMVVVSSFDDDTPVREPRGAERASTESFTEGTMLSRNQADSLVASISAACASRYEKTWTMVDCVLAGSNYYCDNTFSPSRCESEMYAALDRI